MPTVLTVFRFCVLLVAVISHPVLGQDSIPMTSGFRGFVLAGPGYLNVETNADEGFFAHMRFYVPTKECFDRSWTMGNIKKVN
ncbi:MAG: hypothetical protein E2O55_03960 [Gammaproteobacteria bacterium]|nr:MAG: hypothetical protein E2O55_03960 [Gammaproteobacteria bacterium]